MTKERYLTLATLAFFSMLLPSLTQAADIITRQKRIVLDPGHGGKDPGLTSAEGVKEKQVTLELAQLIKTRLNADFNVKLTRNATPLGQPYLLSAEQRVVLANQNNPDLFLSIHLHHATANTFFVFCYNHPGNAAPIPWQARTIKKKESSLKFAESAANLFQAAGVRTSVFQAPIKTLEGVAAPAAMVEPLSISQVPADLNNRTRVLLPHAKRIAQAIRRFFKKY